MRVGHNRHATRPPKFTMDGGPPYIICIRVGGHKQLIFQWLNVAPALHAMVFQAFTASSPSIRWLKSSIQCFPPKMSVRKGFRTLPNHISLVKHEFQIMGLDPQNHNMRHKGLKINIWI